MADLVNGLKSPDLSPLWQLVGLQEQRKQQQVVNERQSRLDQLAMQEFQERLKQNAVENKIRQQNADTNQSIMESNLQSAEVNRKNAMLEQEELEMSLREQRIGFDKGVISNSLPLIGPDLEAILAITDAGGQIPEELEQRVFTEITAAEQALSGGTFGTTFERLKNNVQKAISSDNFQDWDRLKSDIENIVRFSRAEEEEQVSEYEQIRTDNIRHQMLVREEERQRSNQQASKEERDAKALGDKLLTSVDKMLNNPDGLENAVGGMFNLANPGKFVPGVTGAYKEFMADFDFLKSNMTLDNAAKLKGPTSDRDLIFVGDATGLRLNRTEAGFKDHLIGLKNELEALGYDSRAPEQEEPENEGPVNEVPGLSPFTMQILSEQR